MKLKYWKKTERSAFLSLDDTVWGVLSLRTLHHLYPFASEQEISGQEAQELIKLLQNSAWKQLTDYLAKAEHSEHQCRNFLRRKEYHPQIIDQCIRLCKEKGYLDDARFAGILIKSLFDRGKSRRAITNKLYEHSISPSIYEPIIKDLHDPVAEQEMMKEQIQKLSFRYRELEPYKAKEKIFASLFRKGFSLEAINSAWNALDKN